MVPIEAILPLGLFLLIVVTSPYWLFREMVRKEDETLPDWMGSAGSRKRRLTLVLWFFSGIGAFIWVLMAFGLL